MDQLLSPPVLKRLFVILHVGLAQVLYIPSEIALALLAHPLAVPVFAAIFAIGKSALLDAIGMRGTRGNMLGRISHAIFGRT